MGKLTDDEQKLLDELTARANEPDAEDFEVEIYDTTNGKGARLPISKGQKWLYDNFGIGDPPPNAEPAADEGKPGKARKEPEASSQRQGYFGRQAG